MDKIIAFAKSIAQYVIHHRCLNLDIMVDENDNPRLIEYNINGMSTWLYQFNNGSAFGEYTDEIIEYCYKNIHNINRINIIF
jgi:D-alanine-D-alanine ligase-like ATP-grasp enzyme